MAIRFLQQLLAIEPARQKALGAQQEVPELTVEALDVRLRTDPRSQPPSDSSGAYRPKALGEDQVLILLPGRMALLHLEVLELATVLLKDVGAVEHQVLIQMAVAGLNQLRHTPARGKLGGQMPRPSTGEELEVAVDGHDLQEMVAILQIEVVHHMVEFVELTW